MKVLRRDHHLGLEPVVHLNRIPEKFVCQSARGKNSQPAGLSFKLATT
jgi:hypothetical protein